MRLHNIQSAMFDVQGRIFTDVSMPAAAAEERRAAYFALAATLGKLHSVKPAEVGLGNYSRNHGYCARQVRRALSAIIQLFI